ncbi:MAG: hypothetical protein ACM3MG_09995 [Bacillota bacterium]
MIEPQWKSCTEEEVWKYVAWHLAKNGIETILVGGAVAAIYSDGIYKSGDLDLVLKTYLEGKLTPLMDEIGFQKSNGRHYIHPKCDKFIEFMYGPAGIGDDVNIKPDAVLVVCGGSHWSTQKMALETALGAPSFSGHTTEELQ